MNPAVTILCISFNQANYIKQALDGFLMQKTSFPVEIIVHDDCSTDGTAEIVAKYAAKHPSITAVIEKQNQYSKHGLAFLEKMYQQAQGKYIAVCEGDDFWTNPDKLQKQYDFMETHPDYAVCFHRVNVMVEDDPKRTTIFPDQADTATFDTAELLRRNYIQTNSVFYRRQKYSTLPVHVIPFDWYMHLYHAQFGKIGLIEGVMSTYRKHSGGMWWESEHNVDSFWRRHGKSHFALFSEVGKMYSGEPAYEPIIGGWIALILSKLAHADTLSGTRLVDEAVTAYPRADNYYVRALGEALFAQSEKSTLTDNHIHNLEEQLQGHVAYIRKLEQDIHSTTDELRSVHSSAAYKVLKRLNHKFSDTPRD